MKYRKIVIAINTHPDFYPPTLNAIQSLSSKCEELVVITRNNCINDYLPAPNIKYKKIGKFALPYELEKKSKLKKMFAFMNFCFLFFSNCLGKNTELIIVYDPIPLLSLYTFKWLLSSKKKFWYHNHDIPEINNSSKFSIGWFAAKYEHKALQKMNYFSLPSNDRLKCYPKIASSIKYFYIPNYPSVKIYNKSKLAQINNANKLKIIFQGSIGKGHAIEQIVNILHNNIDQFNLELILKGAVRESYKKELENVALERGVANKIKWIGIGPYLELKYVTISCDIGIAIHKGQDVMNATLGTASNKIYEYIACGLPILVYDNEQFRKYLNVYKWAVFTDGTETSLVESLKYITGNYKILSEAARIDFEKEFNFENYFDKICLD